MAQFKILLVTPSIKKNEEKDLFFTNFLLSTISEFYSDISFEDNPQDALKEYSFSQQKITHCYSYNESISIHTNSQKDFSFSMLRNLWQNDERIVNPFVPIIHNGSQILLIDQYNNHFMFTVKSIAYELKEENIVYNYSCQDSFTYQTIRQNAGYFIDNDPTSEDFIGAKTLDWWVSKKIQPECHIGYKYLFMQQGLWLDNFGRVHEFEYLNDISKKILELNNGTYCVEILKQPWNSIDHSDFFEPISFSADGSNASQTLIDLGSRLGLNLRTFERCLDDGSFIGYFWFEETKHENNSGLSYSPYSSIQSFGFNHEGAALTTLLNVQSNTIGEELITLLPETPPFFLNLFHSKQWTDTKYTTGWFSHFCTNQVFIGTETSSKYQLNIDEKDWKIEEAYYVVRIPLINFYVPEHYPYISFLSSEGNPSMLTVSGDIFTNFNSQWQLILVDNETEKILTEDLSMYKGKELNNIQLKITLERDMFPDDMTIFPIGNAKVYFQFFRDVTEEEVKFAQAADKCPWLENKLIDFTYFLNHNIINIEEYEVLLNTIKNELRIVNGQIIYYNKAYQEALQEKTTTLSTLLSQLETLNATMFAEIVDKYARNGRVDSTSYFDKVYSGVQTKLNEYTNSSILDRESLMSEYAKNCFDSQQAFLKNMYNFYDYFNSPIDWDGEDASITEYVLEVDNSNINKNYITFAKPSFLSLTENNFNLYYDKNTGKTNEFIYESDLITQVTPVHEDNMQKFFIPKNKSGEIKQETSDSSFSREKTYYRKTIKIEIEKITTDSAGENQADTSKISHKKTEFKYVFKNEEKETTIEFKFISRDESYWYYVTKKATQLLTEQERLALLSEGVLTNQIELTDGTNKYYAIGTLFSQSVVLSDMINDYLLSRGNKAGGYYIRKSLDYKKFNNFISDSQVSQLMSEISPVVMGKIIQPGNTQEYKDFSKEYENRVKHTNKMHDDYSKKEKEDLVNLYWENIPLTSLWYKGPKYYQVAFKYHAGGSSIELDSQRANKSGQTVSEYLDYLIEQEQNVVQSVENPLNYEEYQEVAFVTPRNEYNYYRNILDVANNWWIAAPFVIGGLSPIVGTTMLAAGWLMIAAIWEWWGTSSAALSGRNNRAWDKSDIDWGQIYDYKIGYWDWNDENIDENKDSKKIRPVYFTSPSSYDIYKKYMKAKDVFFDTSAKVKLLKQGETTNKNTFQYKDRTFSIEGSSSLNKENKKYYHSYYNQIAYTPHLAKQDDKIYYQYSDFVMQHLEDKISLEDKYYILPLVNWKNERFFRNGFDLESCANIWKKAVGENTSFDKVIYHPISSPSQLITFSSLPYREEPYTLKEALSFIGYVNCTNINNNQEKNYKTCFIQGSVSLDEALKPVIFLVFKDRNYQYVEPWGKIETVDRDSYYTGDVFYTNKDTEEEVDFNLINGLTRGFYSSWNTDSNAIRPSSWSKDERFYHDEELTNRAYTVDQLIKANTYYFVNSQKITLTTMSNKEELFKQELYLHDKKGRESVVESEGDLRESYKTDEVDIKWNEIFETGNKEEDEWPSLVQTYQGVQYSTKYWITKTEKSKLSGITKGEFWLNHHKNTMFPTIQQEAKVIETQLTDYWYNAYLNSKFCEYFLPESWKTEINSSPNCFCGSIINTYKKEAEGVIKDETIYAHLLNIYIPNVKIYKEQGKTLLPYYTIKKKERSLNEVENKYLTDSINEFSLNKLQKNAAIKNMYQNILGENLNSWSYLENSAKKTYYYSTSGGTKWNEFLRNMGVSVSNYSLLEGLYVTMFKLLRDKFTTNHFEEYNRLKKQQQTIWNRLYKDFPGILLENTYSNEDATTPEELYRSSYLYFKDISQPERGYNITMINQAEIQGFKGQELKVGDSIRVNVSEYYDENDDIQKTLSQLLFITDISYSLRSDSDLQLTVNNIKYQDKLIRRLAKLIK